MGQQTSPLVHFYLNVDPSLVSGEGALDNTGF